MFSVSEVLKGIGNVFTPVADLVDNVHTSEEEKLELKNKLISLQNEVTKGQMDLLSKNIDLEQKFLEAQTSILTAETNSDSWLAKSWRPITMLIFLAMTTGHALGLIEMSQEMSDNYFALVKIGLGGYIVSRGVEKAAPSLVKAVGNK